MNSPSASLVTVITNDSQMCATYTSRSYYSRVVFISLRASDCAATIRGRRLFEGGDYLRAVTIRGRRLFEEIRYTSSKNQVGTTEQGYSGKVTLTCSPIICIRFCRYRKETITKWRSWDLGMRLVRSVSLIFKNNSEC